MDRELDIPIITQTEFKELLDAPSDKLTIKILKILSKPEQKEAFVQVVNEYKYHFTDYTLDKFEKDSNKLRDIINRLDFKDIRSDQQEVLKVSDICKTHKNPEDLEVIYSSSAVGREDKVLAAISSNKNVSNITLNRILIDEAEKPSPSEEVIKAIYNNPKTSDEIKKIFLEFNKESIFYKCTTHQGILGVFKKFIDKK